jgi:hypothetical protein
MSDAKMGDNPMDNDLRKLSDAELDQLWSAIFVERMRRLQPEPDETMHIELVEGVDERYEDMIRWSDEAFKKPTTQE